MPNPTKPTTNLTREELERQVRDFYPSEEVDLRLLFEGAKRNAVALFKENHGDGDTAIYQFISDVIPLINTYTQAKEREARIDEAKIYRKSYPKRNTRTNDLSRMTRGDLDRRIGELIALKDEPKEK